MTYRRTLIACTVGISLLVSPTKSSLVQAAPTLAGPVSSGTPDFDLPVNPPTLIFTECDAIATTELLGQSCVTNPYSQEDVCYTITASTADMSLDDGWCVQALGQSYPAEPCQMQALLKLHKINSDGLGSSPMQCPSVPGGIHTPEGQRQLGDALDEFPDCAYWHYEGDGRKPTWAMTPPTNIHPVEGASEGLIGPPDGTVPCGEEVRQSATVSSGGTPSSAMTATITFKCHSPECGSGG